MTADALTLSVVRLGGDGDGVVETPDGPRFVAGALPGELVTLACDGGVVEIARTSPERRGEALCPHFGACGGCSLQHLSDDLYTTWKASQLTQALQRHGLETEGIVAPLWRVPANSRRRAALGVRLARGKAEIGFNVARSHDLEPLEACAVLTPGIMRGLDGLKALAGVLLPRDGEARVTVIDTAAGLDAAFAMPRAKLTAEQRSACVAIARANRIARVTAGDEDVVVLDPPALDIAGVAVVPPPGAFVQAVAEAEVEMARLVVDGVGKAKSVADLFAGLGTFTFGVARRARVLAVDSERALLAALDAGARKASGLKPITTKVRDLFGDPLSPRELDTFDAVVLDPPRAGAKAQAEALAKSKVRTVVAVSCHPATLARDLAILTAGGYRLQRATPVDQFLFTPHLEAVAVLTRPKR
ncbi:MAG: hypothetical protein R3D68_09050 [Hyphomicrobiaceae bacterium]